MKLKRFVCAALGLLFLLGASVSAAPVSGLPYDAYIYDNDGEPLLTPAPYTVEKTLSGADFGADGFSGLSDVFYDGADRLYWCDTGNNRVLVTDTDYRLLRVIDSAAEGTGDPLSAPTGCYANDEAIYIADSGNSRIVVLRRSDYQPLRVLERPAIPQLGDDYTYTPLRLSVDHAGRIYVVAKGVNKGLIRLAPDGSFTSFFGAPDVEYNVLQLLWRKIATKEQRQRMEQYVPTEYSAIQMDKKGFIYAVSQTSATTPVAKLNSAGEDVLAELSAVGDSDYRQKQGLPGGAGLTDIALGSHDTFSLLNATDGKLYVYNADGELLYAFGGTGSQKGLFYTATAIEQVGEHLLVTDGTKGTVTVYTRTEFGRMVQTAMQAYDEGDYDASYAAWQEARRYCSHYTPAITGMARISIARGDTDAAMRELKSIHAQELYSKAFEKSRNQFIRRAILPLALGLAVILTLVWLLKRALHKSRRVQRFCAGDFYRKQRYATYTMFHPFDGYWDIKHEKRGDLKTALLILAAFILCYAVRAQFSGYAVTGTISENVNVPYQLMLILLPIAFWVIANWCFTALMDGKGTMRDIVTATGYALKPYVLLSVPLFLLSHVLTQEEAMIYTLLDGICLIWVLGLLFFGMMTIHDYSLSKSVLTVILTLLGMCIILFILLLLASLVQEIYNYFYGIYKELVFRTY